MRWSLKASKKIGKNKSMTLLEWVQQLEADGYHEDAQRMLGDEPDLFQDLAPYWNAFHILTSSRSMGMGVGPIPLTAYESYFRIFGVDSLEEQLNYLKFVGVLDSEYLKWQGEQNESEKRKREAKAKKGSTPPRR